MRITTNMLRNSSLLGTSMLNGLMRNKSSKTLSADKASKYANILKNSTVSGRIATCGGYVNTADSAESLRQSASVFASKSSNNIFDNARRTGSTEGLLTEAKNLVKNYNNTTKNLGQSASSIDGVYKRMMESAASDNSAALGEIGISVGKDKSLSIDENKFRNAGVDAIEKALGSGSSFSSHMEFVSDSTAKSAINSGITNYNQYSANGLYGNNNFLSSLLSSRYNFWF